MKKAFSILVLLYLTSAMLTQAQWVSQYYQSTLVLRSVSFVSAQTGYAGGNSGTVLKTTNGGINWVSVNANSTDLIRSIFFFDANTGIYCGDFGKIRRTTNGGTSWDSIPSGTNAGLFGLSFYGSNGICSGGIGNFNNILLYSSNSGASWTIASQGAPEIYIGTQMLSASIGYVVGEDSSGIPKVAKTTNGGINWSYYTFLLNSLEGTFYYVYFINQNEGFTAANVSNWQGAISYTSNSGQNWSSQLFAHRLFGIDFPSQNIGYAVGDSGMILKTTDKGITWNTQNSGVIELLRAVDFVDNLTGYAVGSYGRIIKTTNGGVTAIRQISSEVRDFMLYQNYPNPFNPTTKIRFSVPLSKGGLRGLFIKFTIYNVLGSEIITLVNQELKPGTYEVQWDASGYPSGIYFCKLLLRDFSAVKKMVFLK